MLEDKLTQHGTSSDGGCSQEFEKGLREFVEKRINLLECTRRALHLDVGHVGKKDSCVEEFIAANISGISAKQPQVRAYDIIHAPYHLIYHCLDGSCNLMFRLSQTFAIFSTDLHVVLISAENVP